MQNHDTPHLTLENLQEIEARAHQLRSEAMHRMLRAALRGLAAAFRHAGAPRHA
jgi:cyclopropane fatty-acyl-phospholipid synthase-like methyltransferase